MLVMPFGRYKGATLTSIPLNYLAWLAGRDLREPLKSAVADELDSRRRVVRSPFPACPDPGLAARLVVVGRRVLAKTCHPDTGGSHREFLRLTETVEWLEDLIGAAS